MTDATQPTAQQARAMADAGARITQKLVDLVKRLRQRIDGRAYTDMREHDVFVAAHQRLSAAISQVATGLPQIAANKLDIHDWIEAAHKTMDATVQLAELSGSNADLIKEAQDLGASIEPTIAEAYNGGNSLWGVAAVAVTALAITYAISKSSEEADEKRRQFYDPRFVLPKKPEEEPPEPEADENGIIG